MGGAATCTGGGRGGAGRGYRWRTPGTGPPQRGRDLVARREASARPPPGRWLPPYSLAHAPGQQQGSGKEGRAHSTGRRAEGPAGARGTGQCAARLAATHTVWARRPRGGAPRSDPRSREDAPPPPPPPRAGPARRGLARSPGARPPRRDVRARRDRSRGPVRACQVPPPPPPGGAASALLLCTAQ